MARGVLHNSGYALRFVYQIVEASCFGFYVRTLDSMYARDCLFIA